MQWLVTININFFPLFSCSDDVEPQKMLCLGKAASQNTLVLCCLLGLESDFTWHGMNKNHNTLLCMSTEISVIMGNCVNNVTSKGYKKESRNQIKCALYFIIVVRLNKLEKEVKRKKGKIM